MSGFSVRRTEDTPIVRAASPPDGAFVAGMIDAKSLGKDGVKGFCCTLDGGPRVEPKGESCEHGRLPRPIVTIETGSPTMKK
ncbi:MAG: hypothetical protein WBW61_00265, partial [Rhodanobacteraceae bacterium]